MIKEYTDMQNILQNNINSLTDENEDIRTFFRGKNIHQNSKDLVVGTEVIEGRKILFVQKDDKVYQLDSLYSEKLILDKWYNQFDNQNYRSRYLLFGFGNGMYVRKLLRHIGPDAVILVLEPSVTIFEKIMQEFDITDILQNKQVHLLVEGISEVRFRDYLGDYLENEDKSGSILRSYLNYPYLFHDSYAKFEETIRFHINRLEANQVLMQRMGIAYFDNTMANYPYIIEAKSIIDLNLKIPKDIPAILVSAGPSLDKNVQELKKAKNRSFILAVDAAAKVLVKNDILPDAIITIDALKLYKHFEDSGVQNIPLFANPHCSRGAMYLHKGDKYFLQDKNTHVKAIFDSFHKMVVDIQGGGSVATDGYALLERLQFKTIVLVGQDLAYTDNKTHSSGTVRGEMGMNIFDQDTLQVEDIHGNMITTSYEFQIYQDWFEEEIRVNPEYRVIDATEGGARIKGTIVKTLTETIEEYCHKTVNMDSIMESVVPRLTEDEKIQFKDSVDKIPDKLSELKQLVKKSIRNYEKMLQLVMENKYHTQEMQRLFEKTNLMLEEVERAPEYYYVWCLSYAKLDKEFDYDLYAGKEDKKEELKASLEQALKYCRLLNEEIENCIEKVKEWLIIVKDNDLRYKEICAAGGNTEEIKRIFKTYYIE